MKYGHFGKWLGLICSILALVGLVYLMSLTVEEIQRQGLKNVLTEFWEGEG